MHSLSKIFKDFYVRNFVKCKKCGKLIEPSNGYWHRISDYPQIGGYFHTRCGLINNPTPKGFFPFSA